jgi:Glyoxalase/Bleomycin resistance protein/Dioxygenase superfamily
MYTPYYALTNINVGGTVSRIQLALNVSNLDEAIEFYSKYFRSDPAKIRPGYANFAIDEPPLKLVLIEGGGEPGAINHLGVEVFSTDEVAEATTYLSSVGMTTDIEEQTTCCYAVQDKVWVDGPDGTRWETYTVLADANTTDNLGGDERCCTSATTSVAAPMSSASNCC